MKKKVMSLVMSSMIFASLVNSADVNAEDQTEEPPADIFSEQAVKSCSLDDVLAISENNAD